MPGSQRRDGERRYAVCFSDTEPVEVRVCQSQGGRPGWHTIWMHGEPFRNRIAMDAIKAARAA